MSVLEISRIGSTAVLTMNNPAKRNVLDVEMRRAFAEALPEIRGNPSVRSVVLTGAGGHFCAGGDIRTMGSRDDEADVFATRDRIRVAHRWVDELADLEKPVIAAVRVDEGVKRLDNK